MMHLGSFGFGNYILTIRSVGSVRENLDLARERFHIIAGIVADFQTRTIVTGFYFTILVPFGLIARLSKNDPLRRSTSQVAWMERSPVPADAESAKQQG
jgi:hypothetical protein